jgi:hypothetical protein
MLLDDTIGVLLPSECNFFILKFYNLKSVVIVALSLLLGKYVRKLLHDDSKGRAIRRGPYSLEPLVSHKFTWRSVDSRGYRVYQSVKSASGTLGARGAS